MNRYIDNIIQALSFTYNCLRAWVGNIGKILFSEHPTTHNVGVTIIEGDKKEIRKLLDMFLARVHIVHCEMIAKAEEINKEEREHKS